MISEKTILHKAIKYRNAILKRLNDKNIILKKEDLWVNAIGITSCVNNAKKELSSYVDENGIIRIYESSWKIKGTQDYAQLHFTYDSHSYEIESKILAEGISLYKSNFDTEGPFVKYSDIEKVLSLFYANLIYIELPNDYRLPLYLRNAYIDIIKRQISLIPEIRHLSDHYYTYNYSTHNSFHPNRERLLKVIEERNVFAYQPIYKEIEWDIEFVKQNKDYIDWKSLLEDSNIVWTEELVNVFYEYIPFANMQETNYCDKFNEKCIKDYSILGHLSNDFINTHKGEIEWRQFLETGIFQWEPEDLEYFFNYASTLSIPYSENFKSTTAGSQISLISLFHNKNFKWNSELLNSCIHLRPWGTLDVCISNKYFHDLLETVPNYKQIIDDLIKKEIEKTEEKIKCEKYKYQIEKDKEYLEGIKSFWLKYNNGGAQPNDAYKEYFTIDNIIKNKETWETIIEEKFLSMQRTPDTNYHYHVAFNMWDRFSQNNHILLDYETSKLLSSLTIKLGGLFVLEDGCYLSEDNRHQEFNALKVFAYHGICDNAELEKIIMDDCLMDTFMNSGNIHIIDYLTDELFKDYSLDSYLELINDIQS